MSTEREQMEALQEDAKRVLPVYIAVDHSWSMSPSENDAIDAANELIPAIIDTCEKNPLADERARFCIIGFNGTSEVVSPLARGTNLAPHTFTASGGTSFTQLFTLLRTQLESDYVRLTADGYSVYRPAVFLITDGEPICDDNARAAAFAALTDPSFSRRPNLTVFGLGPNVQEETVRAYTSGKQGHAFLTRTSVAAAEALGGFVNELMMSIVSSTQGAAPTGAPGDDSGYTWNPDFDSDEIFMVSIDS